MYTLHWSNLSWNILLYIYIFIIIDNITIIMNHWLLVSPRHLRSIQTIGSRRWTDGCSASVTLLLSGHSGMPGFEFRRSRYVKVTLGSFDQKKQWDSYIMTIYLIPYTTRNCKHCTSPLGAIWARGSLSNSDNYFQSWIVSPCKPQTIIWGFRVFAWIDRMSSMRWAHRCVTWSTTHPGLPSMPASRLWYGQGAMRCKILAKSMTQYTLVCSRWERRIIITVLYKINYIVYTQIIHISRCPLYNMWCAINMCRDSAGEWEGRPAPFFRSPTGAETDEHRRTFRAPAYCSDPWQWKSNGGFRAIGVLPNHPKFDHFSIESHDFLEIHHFKKPPFGSQSQRSWAEHHRKLAMEKLPRHDAGRITAGFPGSSKLDEMLLTS